MPTKSIPGQCKFLVNRLERLLSRIAKAIAEEDTDFQLAEFKSETSSLLKQLEESTTYLIDHPTEDSQTDNPMSTFIGIKDKLDDLGSDYRRLLKRDINATDATSAATNSANQTTKTHPVFILLQATKALLSNSALTHQQSPRLDNNNHRFQ